MKRETWLLKTTKQYNEKSFSTFRFLVLCTYKPETLTVRAGINLPKSNPGDVLIETKSHGVVEPYDDRELNDNSLQPARLEAMKEETEQSS